MSQLLIEPSPHIKSKATTQRIMLHVLTALMPAVIAGGIIFGPRALLLTVFCAAMCVGCEALFDLLLKRKQTIGDLSAAVTGVLLALNLPPSLPFYMAAIGCIAAIIAVKQFFGGIGQNFANPAITARIILMLSFGRAMTTWTEPFAYLNGTDAVSAATVLGGAEEFPSAVEMLLGCRAGCIGETSIIALLIGGIYLCVVGVIDPLPPVCFIGTVALCTLISGGDVLMSVMSGGLVLGAVFMATDYSTTPITKTGRVIFCVGCGLMTFIIRSFGVYPEGVSFSILLMNVLTPLIDRYIYPRPFGTDGERKKND